MAMVMEIEEERPIQPLKDFIWWPVDSSKVPEYLHGRVYTQEMASKMVRHVAQEAEKKEQEKQSERVLYIATAMGYNELAKLTDVLGEKVYYRLMREQYQKKLTEAGGQMLFAQDEGVCSIEVPGEAFRIKFLESDIAAMRQAVADYDAEKNG